MTGRILAVDPGSIRIGIAISDPMAMIASPLTMIRHTSMEQDCRVISDLCSQHDVALLIIGQPLGPNGESTPQSRHAQKIAEFLVKMVDLPVELWDESGSTQKAKRIKVEMGVSRKKRSGHLDAHAAAVILQDYLDASGNRRSDEPEE